MSTKKVLLKKKTTGTTAKVRTKTANKTPIRLMSIGFGADKDFIKKIDAVANKKDMTRAKFMKVAVEKAIGLR